MEDLEFDANHKQVMEYGPLAVDPFFFSRRIDGMDPNISSAIYQVLKSEEYLDEENLLRVDPRRSVRLSSPSLLYPCAKAWFCIHRRRYPAGKKFWKA